MKHQQTSTSTSYHRIVLTVTVLLGYVNCVGCVEAAVSDERLVAESDRLHRPTIHSRIHKVTSHNGELQAEHIRYYG